MIGYLVPRCSILLLLNEIYVYTGVGRLFFSIDRCGAFPADYFFSIGRSGAISADYFLSIGRSDVFRPTIV